MESDTVASAGRWSSPLDGDLADFAVAVREAFLHDEAVTVLSSSCHQATGVAFATPGICEGPIPDSTACRVDPEPGAFGRQEIAILGCGLLGEKNTLARKAALR